jgi:Uma2 family endonuclease
LVATIYAKVKADRLGLFATAGVLWSNDEAEFATLPDAFFISNESYELGRVRFSNGGNPRADATEVIGTPDIVVELVSDVSEEKDTEWAMGAYSTAGVPEYWLIDARGKRLRFDVFSRRSKGYVARKKSGGWVKSAVLAREFRLVRGRVNHGFPSFQLEVR